MMNLPARFTAVRSDGHGGVEVALADRLVHGPPVRGSVVQPLPPHRRLSTPSCALNQHTRDPTDEYGTKHGTYGLKRHGIRQFAGLRARRPRERHLMSLFRRLQRLAVDL